MMPFESEIQERDSTLSRDLLESGDLALSRDLLESGDLTLSRDLLVSGDLTLSRDLLESGDLALSRDLLLPASPKMPVLFIGHGSPMNAITDNPFASMWEAIGSQLPTPSAIICVSAHWQTRGTKVTAMEHPKTLHDFGGFPPELFAVQYPAPGSPEVAEDIARLTKETIELDHEWGLDHGTWSVLNRMYPKADIPVLQISLDVNQSPLQHSEIARQLSYLRDRGVLIIGSGNIVHNLRAMTMDGNPYDWAQEFDATATSLIERRDVSTLANYASLGQAAQMSIPTNEHYLPMIYSLALATDKDDITFFNEKIELGSVSMRSFVVR